MEPPAETVRPWRRTCGRKSRPPAGRLGPGRRRPRFDLPALRARRRAPRRAGALRQPTAPVPLTEAQFDGLVEARPRPGGGARRGAAADERLDAVDPTLGPSIGLGIRVPSPTRAAEVDPTTLERGGLSPPDVEFGTRSDLIQSTMQSPFGRDLITIGYAADVRLRSNREMATNAHERLLNLLAYPQSRWRERLRQHPGPVLGFVVGDPSMRYELKAKLGLAALPRTRGVRARAVRHRRLGRSGPHTRIAARSQPRPYAELTDILSTCRLAAWYGSAPSRQARSRLGFPRSRTWRAAWRTPASTPIWLYDHLLYRWPDQPTEGLWECWTVLGAGRGHPPRADRHDRAGRAVPQSSRAGQDGQHPRRHQRRPPDPGPRRRLGTSRIRRLRRAVRPSSRAVSKKRCRSSSPLLRDGRVEYHGTYYSAADCELLPRGPQPNGPS